MDWFGSVNWSQLLMPDTPLLEIFARGTLMYLGLFLILRVVLKRHSGAVSMSDLLVIVLLADAAQNGLAGDYHSISDGLALVATIIFWSYALDWLGYHVPVIQRLVHPAPLLLVKSGQMLRANMRHELITREELLSLLREQGVDDISEVKEAFLEGSGQISVVKNEPSDANQGRQKQRAF